MKHSKRTQEIRIETLNSAIDDEYNACRIFLKKAFKRYMNASTIKQLKYYNSQMNYFRKRKEDLLHRKYILLQYKKRYLCSDY